MSAIKIPKYFIDDLTKHITFEVAKAMSHALMTADEPILGFYQPRDIAEHVKEALESLKLGCPTCEARKVIIHDQEEKDRLEQEKKDEKNKRGLCAFWDCTYPITPGQKECGSDHK